METPYVQALVKLANSQYLTYKDHVETDPVLSAQIKVYWDDLGFPFPGVQTAWSAVFVSWCIKTTGATRAEFHFSDAHSEFVFFAIKNRKAGIGVFQAYDFNEVVPELGDILQNNRNGNKYNYAYASAHSEYLSHSAIVVKKGADAQGPYLITVGGNESNSIRTKRIALSADGKILPRVDSPFISLIKDSK
ncbi:DUF2272 domain-containing protein [Mucilaginibacter sp.]|uniref:DUF2272 domain-containing protein n=1 Tax=Mucilaginibacter sp. TaxID=1882438 RepID=UPI003D109FCC